MSLETGSELPWRGLLACFDDGVARSVVAGRELLVQVCTPDASLYVCR